MELVKRRGVDLEEKQGQKKRLSQNYEEKERLFLLKPTLFKRSPKVAAETVSEGHFSENPGRGR